MILRQVLMEGAKSLREAGIEGPERDARLLLAEVIGMPAARMSLEPDLKVTEAQTKEFHGFLARRAAREPVSKILGRRNFWGRDFEITPDVLDPRPETETLIDLVLKGAKPATILDLGCGSGIIALTLLAELPEAKAQTSDISQACLDVTHRNAKALSVSDRLTAIKSNWFSDIHGEFDLIVSNPPYISDAEMAELSLDVFNHDPHLALTPGGDGLAPYEVLAKGARKHLAPKGRTLVEIGYRQGPDVVRIFQDAGLTQVACHKDLNGHDRVVSAHQS